ncbi:DnaJ family domain-containing protein [Paenibacillus turpanensis]|uniref:DnaJ family domain-containing protein n=1 Tax=Paenibacillus turpanensis TaxID=2689078 RepID=UPI00140CCA89|nr:DnaJ family domain-containing protein [Paenibacillus turpanensis]
MDFYQRLAEDRIREAMERGEFDNLPGKGKPLDLDDLSHVPEELRVGYKLLKNAGVLPEEMQLRKDMVTLTDLIRSCTQQEERNRLQRQLTEKQLRFKMLLESRGIYETSAFVDYEEKLRDKMAESPKQSK